MSIEDRLYKGIFAASACLQKAWGHLEKNEFASASEEISVARFYCEDLEALTAAISRMPWASTKAKSPGTTPGQEERKNV